MIDYVLDSLWVLRFRVRWHCSPRFRRYILAIRRRIIRQLRRIQ